MPEEFIPLVERTGLIMPLTSYVLDAALRDVQQWRGKEPDLRVAVNVSMRNLLDGAFPLHVHALLSKWAIPAALLELEITERSLVADPRRVHPVLEQLSKMGIRIAIDDFRTGYASLALLRRLPVDRIKIDRSFVTGMDASEDDASIVRSTIDLAHNLGLQVVAEGVETEAVYRGVAELGCDAGQGYHLGRPMPVDELVPWLGDRGRLRLVRDVSARGGAAS
jgi:EAL domain-containing protein (putative c-di-GMP-specific phosphodiesterase class I)